jgi:hypothetical protein
MTIVLRYQCGYINQSYFDDACLKDPDAFWGLSSDLLPEKQRGDADGPGAACWDLPTPWVWKRPQKEDPPSGLGVWSCLVLSRA